MSLTMARTSVVVNRDFTVVEVGAEVEDDDEDDDDDVAVPGLLVVDTLVVDIFKVYINL